MTDKQPEDRKSRAEEDTSLWRFYAFGHAIEDRSKNSRMLKVFLSEINPLADGELGFEGTEVDSEGTDLNNAKTNATLRSENSIDCDWVPLSSNRPTPPDVVKGEPVLVYRYGDDNKYYWKETGLREELRKLETAVFRFAANPEGANNDPNNYYFFEISTDRKLVTFQTSKANGEPFAVTVQFDMDKGTFHLSDDTGNQMEADFAKKHFAIENADGSVIDLTEDHIFSKNKTGSIVDINADRIFAQNKTGTIVDLSAGNAEVNAPTLARFVGAGYGIQCDASGIKFIR